MEGEKGEIKTTSGKEQSIFANHLKIHFRSRDLEVTTTEESTTTTSTTAPNGEATESSLGSNGAQGGDNDNGDELSTGAKAGIGVGAGGGA